MLSPIITNVFLQFRESDTLRQCTHIFFAPARSQMHPKISSSTAPKRTDLGW
jgi:hypothetical protein